jgi:outer membrane translocation and assembly module TamA
MKRLLSLIICCCCLNNLHAQKKLMERFLKNDTTRHNSFLPVPVLGYTQELGFEFGLAGLFAFYTEPENPNIRPSNFYVSGIYTTTGSYQLVSKWDIWSKANKYHYQGEFRYLNFPFNFYGTGNQTTLADEDKLTLKRFRIWAEAEKAFGEKVYAGINLQYDQQFFTDNAAGGIYETAANIKDRDGGRVLTLGLSQIIDTRSSNTYPEKGSYVKVTYQYAPDFFGGENFTGSTFRLDLRNFQKIKPKLILGLNLNYNKVDGRGGNPFYMMSQLGGDQIMRGYYLGRYREANLLAAQAELRFRPAPRFGIAAFAGGGNVYPTGMSAFRNLKPNYGAGIRYFFDVEKSMSLRLDYGMGEKPAGEKRISGFYISLGESF